MTQTMQNIGIVESGLASGNYDSGGGASATNRLSRHGIQFGPHREYRVVRLERSADRSIHTEHINNLRKNAVFCC